MKKIILVGFLVVLFFASSSKCALAECDPRTDPNCQVGLTQQEMQAGGIDYPASQTYTAQNGNASNGATSSGGWDVNSVMRFGLPGNSILNIITSILMWLLTAFGFVGIIGFLIAGVLYLISAGDEKQAETAKKAMKYSIYGVVVGLAGAVIIQAAHFLLSGYFF